MQVTVKKGDTLTQKQRDRIIESPYTINLTGELSTKQNKERMQRRIKERKKANLINKIMDKIATPIVITILIMIAGLAIHNAGAEEGKEMIEKGFAETLEEVIEKNDRGETTQEDIDNLIDKLQKEIDEGIIIPKEEIDTSIFPTEEGDQEMIKEFNKTGIKENHIPEKAEKLEFDIDRLSYAVSMAETSHYTKGYGVTHNNGHGIKHGNTAPCPGVPKLYMCKFKTRLESHEAFKKIWLKWYGGFPTYAQAKRWTGGDNPEDWLRIVTYYYQKGI